MRATVERTEFTRIPGYPLYEIDRFGTVRRIFKSKRVEMVPTIKHGVYIIRLQTPDGRRKEERVHKLMQRTYMRPPKENEVLYHKNQNRLDNALSNLAYIDRHTLGRMTGAKSKRRTVAKVDQNGEIVEFYTSAREAAKRNFVSYQTVMDRCNGRVKKAFALDGFTYVWDEAEDA